MKSIKKITKKMAVQQLLIVVIILSTLMAPASGFVSKIGGGAQTVYAAGYKSWVDSWDTGDTYDGLNSAFTEGDIEHKDGALDWLGETLETAISFLIQNVVGSLLLLLTDGMGLTLENIVFGPISGSNGANYFQFGLNDGNVWGVCGSLMYAVFRNFMFAVFAIQFLWLLAGYLIKGSGKGRADLKGAIYNYVFIFSLLYAMPIIVDIVLVIRDTLLKGFLVLTNSTSGKSYSMGVTDLILQQNDHNYTLSSSIILCFMLGSSFIFAFDYVKRALQQVYLFGVFPVVALRSFSDKSILNKWVGHFITSLFIPVLDCIGLWLVFLVINNNGATNQEAPALLGLLVFMAIVSCRNMIAQFFGMPVGGGGFGLMAAAMMLARGLLGAKKGKPDAGKGNNGTNKNPEAGGDGAPISGPDDANGAPKNADASPANGNDGGENSGMPTYASETGSGGDGAPDSPLNETTDYTYDESGNIVSSTTTSEAPVVASSYEDVGSASTSVTDYNDDGKALKTTTSYGDGTSQEAIHTYNDNGGLDTTTVTSKDADGKTTGMSRTHFRDDGTPIRSTMVYGDAGSKHSVSTSYDSEGNVKGSTRIDYGLAPEGNSGPTLDQNITSKTKTAFDADGNRVSSTSESIDSDGNITKTTTAYDPVTAKPTAQTEETFAPGSKYASSQTQTTYDAAGNPAQQVRSEWDAQNHMRSQTETAFDGKGQPISATTSTFDDNGNTISKSVNHDVASASHKDNARERLQGFKNMFTPPTVETINPDGSTRRVQDQDAIKRQIARAERKVVGYPHKADGTLDYKALGTVAKNTLSTAAKTTAVATAVSIGAVGGPQSAMGAGMTAAMITGGGGRPSNQQNAKAAGGAKATGEAAAAEAKVKISKPSPKAPPPRRQNLSPAAKAAEEIGKRLNPN